MWRGRRTDDDATCHFIEWKRKNYYYRTIHTYTRNRKASLGCPTTVVTGDWQSHCSIQHDTTEMDTWIHTWIVDNLLRWIYSIFCVSVCARAVCWLLSAVRSAVCFVCCTFTDAVNGGLRQSALTRRHHLFFCFAMENTTMKIFPRSIWRLM